MINKQNFSMKDLLVGGIEKSKNRRKGIKWTMVFLIK